MWIKFALLILGKFIIVAPEVHLGPANIWICVGSANQNQSVISCPVEQTIVLHDLAVFLSIKASAPCHASQPLEDQWLRPKADLRRTLLQSLQRRCNGESRCEVASAVLDSATDLRTRVSLLQVTYACIPGTQRGRFPCGSTITLNSEPPSSPEQTNQPVGSGYLASYGYPHFYRGDNLTCVWHLAAQSDRSIQLTVLDLSIRSRLGAEQRCQDVVQIREGLALLWEGCGDTDTPQIFTSKGSNLQIILRAESVNLYPKRGLLVHYTAVGCPLPPTPHKGYLVWRNTSHAYFLCCLDHVFPDTGLRHRQLACLNGHRWNDVVPNCVDASESYKDLAHGLLSASYKDTTMALSQETTDTMTEMTGSKKDSNGDYDWTFDFYVPVGLMVGLLIANVVVVLIVLHYRRQPRASGLDVEERVPLRSLKENEHNNFASGSAVAPNSPRKGGTPV